MKADVRIKKLREDAHAPTYGSEFAAGCDLYACIEAGEVTINPDRRCLARPAGRLKFPMDLPG